MSSSFFFGEKGAYCVTWRAFLFSLDGSIEGVGGIDVGLEGVRSWVLFFGFDSVEEGMRGRRRIERFVPFNWCHLVIWLHQMRGNIARLQGGIWEHEISYKKRQKDNISKTFLESFYWPVSGEGITVP